MWSDVGREDRLWSDTEWATDILKRSRRPLLSFFPSSLSFLTQQLVCPLSRIEASCYNPFLLSCLSRHHAPLLSFSRLGRRRVLLLSLSCPVLGRRRAPLLSLPRLGRRRAPLLSLPRLGRRRAPLLSLPRLGRRRVLLLSLSCPVLGRRRTPLLSLSCLGHRHAPLLSLRPALGDAMMAQCCGNAVLREELD